MSQITGPNSSNNLPSWRDALEEAGCLEIEEISLPPVETKKVEIVVPPMVFETAAALKEDPVKSLQDRLSPATAPKIEAAAKPLISKTPVALKTELSTSLRAPIHRDDALMLDRSTILEYFNRSGVEILQGETSVSVRETVIPGKRALERKPPSLEIQEYSQTALAAGALISKLTEHSFILTNIMNTLPVGHEAVIQIVVGMYEPIQEQEEPSQVYYIATVKLTPALSNKGEKGLTIQANMATYASAAYERKLYGHLAIENGEVFSFPREIDRRIQVCSQEVSINADMHYTRNYKITRSLMSHIRVALGKSIPLPIDVDMSKEPHYTSVIIGVKNPANRVEIITTHGGSIDLLMPAGSTGSHILSHAFEENVDSSDDQLRCFDNLVTMATERNAPLTSWDLSYAIEAKEWPDFQPIHQQRIVGTIGKASLPTNSRVEELS